MRSKPAWLLPNLLSLDAPLVAVCWQALLAADTGLALRPAAQVALGLTVWLIYIVDRLLDVRDPHALQTAQQLPQVRNWIVPVGGGGLAAGLSLYLKDHHHSEAANHRIIGCQHQESPALQLSLERGEAVTHLPGVITIAGGVEGGIGRQTFDVLRNRIDGVALVSEDEIRAATRWMIAQHQYLIEPTAAVTLAACLRGRVGQLQGPTVVLVCGRNVSLRTAQECL